MHVTAQHLRQAREHSTGAIYNLHRVTHCPPCQQDHRCNQGRCDKWHDTISTDYGALGCAPEGGKHADPVDSGIVSMRRHYRARNCFRLAVMLAVTSFAMHLAWPLLLA